MSRSCSICEHSELKTIGRLIASGGTNRELAARFKVSRGAIQRHRVEHMKAPRRQKSTINSAPESSGTSAGDLARFDSNTEISTPSDLLDRLRGLFRLGDLLEEAYERRDVDSCVKLAREYRAAAESYARVAGWMTDGASTTVHIDARRQGMLLLSRMDESSLRSAIATLTSGGDAAATDDSGEAAIDVESRVLPP